MKKPDFVTRANQIVAERDRLRTELEAARESAKTELLIARQEIQTLKNICAGYSQLREWKEELGKKLNTCPEHIKDIIDDWEEKLFERDDLLEQVTWHKINEGDYPELQKIVQVRWAATLGTVIGEWHYDHGNVFKDTVRLIGGRYKSTFSYVIEWRSLPLERKG
jgi:hypothetical protein